MTWLLACGHPPTRTTGASPSPELPGRLPLARAFVLEAAGAMPDDTVVTVPPGQGRVVVLRRSAPDFGLFAWLEFPDSSLQRTPGAAAVRLRLHPRLGEYGLDLEVPGSLGPGARLMFSYGSHFVAPAGARERYGSDLLFEHELRIGLVHGDSEIELLPTTLPGTDMLSAALPSPGPGRYLVVAPR